MDRLDDVKNVIKKLFLQALNDEIFPSAAASVSVYSKQNGWEKIYSYCGKTANGNEVKEGTIFDLASLTKPLATVLAVIALIKEGKLDWNQSLSSMLEISKFNNDFDGIKLNHLMAHSSGIPAHKPYFENLISYDKNERKKLIINWILNEHLLFPPGTDSLYSDLGYILLGYIIEKKSGFKISKYLKEKIYSPINLEKDLFFAKTSPQGSLSYVETERCSWSKKMLCGKVHDDNCRAIGGSAGHAGLFGSLNGVSNLCEHLILQWHGKVSHPSYQNEDLRRVMQRQNKKMWTLGFDTPSSVGSSSGKYFSQKSVGHLGFTGTSFWLDLEKKISIVLLTNRVRQGRENIKIKDFRPIFHNSIMRCLM